MKTDGRDYEAEALQLRTLHATKQLCNINDEEFRLLDRMIRNEADSWDEDSHPVDGVPLARQLKNMLSWNHPDRPLLEQMLAQFELVRWE